MDFVNYPATNIRVPISQCLEQIPEIYDLADITHEDLFSAPSSSLGPPEWIQIAQNINKAFQEDPTIDGLNADVAIDVYPYDWALSARE